MPEFSPSFDAFDKGVLIVGVTGISVATAGPTMATIGAGIVLTVVGAAKLGVKLGNLAQQRAIERFKRVQDAMLAVNEKMLEAERKAKQPGPLKDDALWEKQWRDTPVAFWLNPNLWKPGTSEIDWEAVDRPPPPIVAPEKEEEKREAYNAESVYRKAQRQIETLAHAVFSPGQMVEGVKRMGYAAHRDMLEIEYIDGSRKVLDYYYFSNMTASQRMDFLRLDAERHSHAGRRAKVKEIVRFARLQHAENHREHHLSPLWAGRDTGLVYEDPNTGRLIRVHNEMDPQDAYDLAEMIGYYDVDEHEVWD